MKIGGLPGPGSLAHFLLRSLTGGALPVGLKTPRRVLVVLEAESGIEDLADALKALGGLRPDVDAGEPACLTQSPLSAASALERLRAGSRVVLATPETAARPLPGPEQYEAGRWRLVPGAGPGRQEALGRLEALGYQRAEFAEAPGECAARGQVVDVYLPEPVLAVRLLFGGSGLETIRVYDPETQRTLRFLDEATIVPASGGAPLGTPGAGLSAWLGHEDLVFVHEGSAFALPEGVPAAVLSGSLGPGVWDAGARANLKFQGSVALAVGEIRRLQDAGMRVLLFGLNRGEEERLREILEPKLPEGSAEFVVGPLAAGFLSEPDKLAVLTASEIFQRSYRVRSFWPWEQRRAPGRFGWSSLKAGDYVVHRRYGIARYLGITPAREQGDALAALEGHRPSLLPGGSQDCLLLEFRAGDKLYVPLYDFRNVQKYVGAEGKRPRLSSLDPEHWETVRVRVQKGVEELAGEILKREAARRAHGGHAFPADSHLEREFADSFPFEETEDQRKAIEEVQRELMAPHPMDRLVVGDVGFGKTEVALRAALKVVLDMKQVVVLVPTTVLADQHTRNFTRRFAEYPVRVRSLSRFQTTAEQKAVLAEIAEGRCDIVIGTHRLLSRDVRFKDLGLLVIDEEHRFGVKDKEALKRLRSDVDVLSLSATPIPRSLYQAMSGLKSISLIRSAPQGRQPIDTTVGPFDEKTVVRAIHEELARGGQVFYVHNRIQGLEARLKALAAVLPDVRLRGAHGQMPSAQLERTMWEFLQRRHDVLVASSIIESGLDIPSVNTMIVEDAQDFGLAQLYQLRGRVGRGDVRAHCHLFYPKTLETFQELSEDAKKRLSALKEFSALGSGFRLALRDLEIRGAGDLLGAKQHGSLSAVGLEYYCELLNNEVARQRGKPVAERAPVTLDLNAPAGIPAEVLPSDLDRIEFYKRLLAADEPGIERIAAELEDLSGALPPAARNLLRIMRLRLRADKAGLKSVGETGNGQLEVRFRAFSPPEPAQVAAWTKAWPGRLRFLASKEGDGFRVLLAPREEPLDWLESFLSALVVK